MAGDMHGLDFQPQVQPLAGGWVEKGLQQGFAQVLEVYTLGRLRVQAARIGARQCQQLVGKLRSAARGIAQLLDLVNS
ncbi:hypothetical protein D3C71_1066690 [compost metagenome]